MIEIALCTGCNQMADGTLTVELEPDSLADLPYCLTCVEKLGEDNEIEGYNMIKGVSHD